MRAIIQRSLASKVLVKNEIVGEISRGLVVFLGINREDTVADLEYLAKKIINLRIFADDTGKMNLDIQETKGEILLISQFTLYGDCRKGRRPSFIKAALPEKAEHLYLDFYNYLQSKGLRVATGRFGAMMQVEIINDGPVTFILDSLMPKTNKESNK